MRRKRSLRQGRSLIATSRSRRSLSSGDVGDPTWNPFGTDMMRMTAARLHSRRDAVRCEPFFRCIRVDRVPGYPETFDGCSINYTAVYNGFLADLSDGWSNELDVRPRVQEGGCIS